MFGYFRCYTNGEKLKAPNLLDLPNCCQSNFGVKDQTLSYYLLHAILHPCTTCLPPIILRVLLQSDGAEKSSKCG